MSESVIPAPHSEVPSDETVNQLTHGAGLVLSILGAWQLMSKVPVDGYVTVAVWIYAAALVALFAASTLSHSFVSEPHRTRYRTLDQICIFAFIAATYTPVIMVVCDDGWWNLSLILLWLMSGLGIYLKLRVTKEEMVPVWFYIAVALIPTATIPQFVQFAGTDGAAWVVAGGICYILGVVFLTNDRKVRYFHAVWHVLVILGTFCHYVVIHNYTLRLT